MRTVVTVVATALLVVTTLFGMPSRAQSQVIVIIGNGSAQPYYPPPPPYQYPTPYPNPQVAYGGGYITPVIWRLSTATITLTTTAITVLVFLDPMNTGGNHQRMSNALSACHSSAA